MIRQEIWKLQITSGRITNSREMKVYLALTQKQNKFLQDHPDFNIQDWFSGVLNDKISEMEVRSNQINAVIAAAGYDVRISQIDAEIPKAMLKIKGKSLLERQVEVLRKYNINDITVVRGYKKEHLTVAGVNYIDNNEYAETGILHSFFLASEKITGETILLYSDILFENKIIEDLIHKSFDFAVVVDRSWREHYHNRVDHPVSEAELVEVENGLVCRMGLDITPDSAYGEFIGVSAISAKGAERAKQVYKELQHEIDSGISGFEDPSKASLTDFFNALIAKGERIKPVDIFGGWFEIDTFEDYRKSWTIVK